MCVLVCILLVPNIVVTLCISPETYTILVWNGHGHGAKIILTSELSHWSLHNENGINPLIFIVLRCHYLRSHSCCCSGIL